MDYSLYEAAFSKYIQDDNNKSSSSPSSPSPPSSDEEICNHGDVIVENGICTCIECGEEIKRDISNEKEWRYYGAADKKSSSDPNRVQVRRIDEKSIFKDVEMMGFSDKIVSLANDIYMQVTHGKIRRGYSRKSIIFACIFYSFKLCNQPQSSDRLIQIFTLSRKSGLNGLKIVNESMPKDSEIHTTYITPINIIEEIMAKFSAKPDQKREAIAIYEKTKNKSSKLNRSRPQSIASGIVYHWVKLNNIHVTLKEFAEKVNLSELTITKITKEIEDILGVK